MRVTRWTLFAAALAVSMYTTASSSAVKDTTCVDPSIVTSMESKISDLEQSNKAFQLQIDSQNAEKSKLLMDTVKEHEIAVLQLEKEIEVLKNDVEKLQNDLSNEKKTVEKLETELKTALAQIQEESVLISSYTSEIAKLEESFAKERVTVANMESELKAALTKLSEETKRANKLEKSQEIVEKKNKALIQKLGKTKSEDLSVAALLSSYYDSALELAEKSVVFAQEKFNEQSGTLEHVQSKIEDTKKTARDSTSKFYQENLAATLDPILADVRKTVDPILADVHMAVNPHVEQYLPIVQDKAAKAKEQVLLYLHDALRRAKLARSDAIALLEQNEHVGAHAQKVIDGALIILAVPLVLFQIRLALRLVWWLFTTTLYVLTCGLCCGTRKPNSKAKRKIAKKTASVHASLNAPVNGATKKAANSKATMTVQKRTKKGKN
ncbi:unnamed protein product [Peronospora belbahrii]|uniref:Uncharacterized protein n=1 Tax=Peronospora belbahrii TaxID=622444 RepID=A0AAU9KZ00_9STRA|nr:unnamed protein product [Peronospora belbahrii]